MRALVIGGTLFMGREIVMRLLARGHDVAVLHRGASHDLGPDVRNLQADRANARAVSTVLDKEQFDAVFDLAYDWQHGTTADQVEAMARACGERVQRYVFMSSMAAYQRGLDLAETSPLVGDDVPNPYAQHKASAERRLMRMHAATGFPATTIRPPFVHGPRQPLYREQFFWDRLLDGRPAILPEDGSTPMPWAFVSDVAESCVRAMEVPAAAGQAFNVGHVERTTQRSFVELLGRVAGVTPRFVPIPRSALLGAGGQLAGRPMYFGEFLDLPGYGLTVEKAPRVLGVTPTPIEDALRQGFAWYQTQPRRPADYGWEDRVIAAAGGRR
jgi:nucleoside-diphosphate-sugar epimerase